MFSSLTLANWRQFARVRILFHPRLTVLTGANGSGKTTILHLLNRHWGWNLQYVSTPRWDRKGVRKYWAGFWDSEELDVTQPVAAQRRIGRLEYSNRETSDLTIPENVSEVFGVNFANQQQVNGVYVPSHRRHTFFRKLSTFRRNSMRNSRYFRRT